jgi:hypothetical protein
MRQAMYNNVVFSAAKQLMNTATAPQALNASFAQNITNMLPTKGGTLAIRHGTLALGSPTGDGNIIEIMPFVKPDGISQVLVYTDTGAVKLFNEGLGTYTNVITGLNTSGVPFYTEHLEGGKPYLIIVNGYNPNMVWDGTTLTTMSEYVTDLATSETWVSATQLSLNTGTLGVTNYPVGRSVKVTFSTSAHLNVSSLTRVGTTATLTASVAHNLQTGDYVTIAGANQVEYNGTFQITVTSATVLTYTLVGTPATPANGSLQLTFSNITRTTTVSSRSLAGQVVTLTFAAAILPAASVTIVSVAFLTSPEAFSFIFSTQGRLWAIAGGETHPTNFKNNTKRGYVYYTVSLNVVNAWFSPTTMEQAFLDVSNNMTVSDEIIAVNEFREFMVFVGRNHIQFWAGSDPSDANSFGYANSFPIGAVQAKMIQRLPNDLALMTPYGVRTASIAVNNGTITTNGDIGSSIDTTVLKEVSDVFSDVAKYKSCRSFFYAKQGIFGFKLPTKTLVLQVKEESKGWVEFTGDFNLAGAISSQGNGQRLFLAVADQLMRYADGDTSTTLAYSDRGQPIKWNWWTPWVGGTRRWANHAFEIIHNDSAQLSFEILRLKNNSLGFTSSNVLNTSPVMGFWDESFWDVAQWDETTTVIPRIRDKFIAQTMSFVVKGETSVGPFEVVSLTCYGQWER